MQKHKSVKRALVAALAIGLIVMWAFSLFPKRARWWNLQYGIPFRDGKLMVDTAQGDAYGTLNSGPSYDLLAGEYRLTAHVYGDAESEIRLSAVNGAKITPPVLKIAPYSQKQTLYFTIEEPAQGFQLQVEFKDGTFLQVYELTLESVAFADNRFTITFAAIGLLLLLALYEKERENAQGKPMERMRIALMLGAAVLFVCFPTFKDNLTYGIDTTFHIERIRNLADGLRAGQFPVRVGGFSYNGHGAVTSVYYPDFLLTPLALMLLAGASVNYVVHVWIVALNILSAVTMYVCAKRIWKDRWTAACASMLFVFCAYRLMSLYTRGAMGEMMAMTFLPVFLLGLWEVLQGDKRRWPLLAVGATCIFQSHMLGTVMAASVAVIFGVFSLKKLVRERRVAALVKAVTATVLLNLFILVPMLTFTRQGVSAGTMVTSSVHWLMAPAQLFMDAIESPAATSLAERSLSNEAIVLGLPLLLGLFMTVYLAMTGERGQRETRLSLAFGALGMLYALMITYFSPWRLMVEWTHGLLNYVQLPFRLLIVSGVFLSLCGGYALMRFAGERREAMLLAVMVLCAVCAHPLLSDHTADTEVLRYGRESFEAVNLDYRLPGMEVSSIDDTAVRVSDGMQLSDYEKRGTVVTATVDAQQDSELTVPLYAFTGYEAEVNGQALETRPSSDGMLTILLPAGTNGALRVEYAGKAYWKIADAVSLATAAGLAVIVIRRRKMHEA